MCHFWYQHTHTILFNFFFSFNPTGLLSMKVVLASLLHSHWAPQDGTLWKPVDVGCGGTLGRETKVYWLLHQDHPQNPMRFSFKQSQEVSIAGKCWSSYFLLLSSNLSLKVISFIWTKRSSLCLTSYMGWCRSSVQPAWHERSSLCQSQCWAKSYCRCLIVNGGVSLSSPWHWRIHSNDLAFWSPGKEITWKMISDR